MHQLQDLGEHIAQHILCSQLGLSVVAVHAGLGQLDIPVAIGIPDEVIDLGGSHADLKAVQIFGNFLHQLIQLGQEV